MRRHSTTTTEPYSQQWRMVRRSVCVCSGGEVAILSMTQSPREDQYWHDNQILSPPPSSSLEGIHSAMQVTSLPYLFKLLFHCKDDALTKKFNNQRRNEQLSIWRATPHDVIFFLFSVLFSSSHSRFSFNIRWITKQTKTIISSLLARTTFKPLSSSVDITGVFGQRKEDQIGYQYVPEATKTRFVIIIF